jgi:hypothetical protein
MKREISDVRPISLVFALNEMSKLQGALKGRQETIKWT